jgi:hypothetical protein
MMLRLHLSANDILIFLHRTTVTSKYFSRTDQLKRKKALLIFKRYMK